MSLDLPARCDPLPGLMNGARVSMDAASTAIREGSRPEPHLRAARYFLARATTWLAQPARPSTSAASGDPRHSREVLESALDDVPGLRRAMQSRSVVDQAKGILMARLGVDERQSAETLDRLSERGRTPVVDVAHAVIAQAATTPMSRARRR